MAFHPAQPNILGQFSNVAPGRRIPSHKEKKNRKELGTYLTWLNRRGAKKPSFANRQLSLVSRESASPNKVPSTGPGSSKKGGSALV